MNRIARNVMDCIIFIGCLIAFYALIAFIFLVIGDLIN